MHYESKPRGTGFSNRCGPKIARKTGAVSGAEVPGWVPFNFPRLVVASLPFGTVEAAGQGDGHGPKARPINAKKSGGNLGGFVEKYRILKRSIEAARQGFEPWVPVWHSGFKTGAIA